MLQLMMLPLMSPFPLSKPEHVTKTYEVKNTSEFFPARSSQVTFIFLFYPLAMKIAKVNFPRSTASIIENTEEIRILPCTVWAPLEAD